MHHRMQDNNRVNAVLKIENRFAAHKMQISIQQTKQSKHTQTHILGVVIENS